MIKNLKIRNKLFIAFAIVIAGLLAIGIFGGISILSMITADENMYKENLVGIRSLSDITASFYTFRMKATKTVYEDFTAKGADGFVATLNDTKKSIAESLDNYKKELKNETDIKDYEQLSQQFAQYFAIAGETEAMIRNSDKAGITAKMGELGKIAVQLSEKLTAMQNANQQYGQETMEKNKNMGNTSLNFIIAIAVVVILLAIGLALVVTSSIIKPLNKMVKAANKLAVGETDVVLDIKSKDEVGILAKSMGSVVQAVQELIIDANMLAEAAVAGKFNTRADASKHQGDYKKIVDGVNATLDTVVDKVFWYESLLDSIPFPISVTDMDMNWTFINKPVEQMLNIKRADVLGKQCDNWNANICNTENCGIARLRAGFLQTEFEQMNMNFQVDSSYIYNLRGEKVGHIEVVQDITHRVRSAQYSGKEVEKLAENLKRLSDGDLKLTFNVEEGDQYTAAEKKNFEEINQSFKAAVDAISGYIAEISEVLKGMSDGDMTRFIEMDFKGDFVEIKNSVNSILVSLNHVLAEINLAADQVASGTRQVSDGNQNISQGATEQASSIEELSASITQVATQTSQNAHNANTANELALSAKTSATQGNQNMESMQNAMADINEASANIFKIIKVIDDIAFQTNILALNAAVEAARAGVHGKGFAVVAEEVRNLAQRSAQAAKETAALIESSIKKTEAGTQIANVTASSLQDIVQNVEKAAQLVGDIAMASNEQATAITQITKGIDQLSQVVQNNSATAQEGAASSEELSSQAELLKNMVAQFKLVNETEKTAGPAEPQPKEKQKSGGRETPTRTKIILSDTDYGKY